MGKKLIYDILRGGMAFVGGPRTKEPNPRITLPNPSKERQANSKDYAHLRRIKEPKGNWHPRKTKNKGMDGKWMVQDMQGWRNEVSWRRHLLASHSMLCTNLTSYINEEITPKQWLHSSQLFLPPPKGSW